MSLTILPNEILSMVFKQCLLSGGFQDLALSCKRCYLVGRQYARDQERQMQDWRMVPVDERLYVIGWPRLDFITVILKNPDTARWVRCLSMDFDFHGPWYETDSLRRTDLENLLMCVTSRPWFTRIFGKDVQHSWCETLWLEENEEVETAGSKHDPYQEEERRQCTLARAVLLLLLMHNLEEVDLPSRWRYSEEQDFFMLNKAILQLRIQQSNTRSTKSKLLPLSNLRCVRLLHHSNIGGHASSWRFKVIAPFLGLTSLETLHVAYSAAVDDFSSGLSFEWPYRRFISNLKTIKLGQCCFEPKGISELLSHTPHLKTFTYSHARKDNHGQKWNAGAFVNTIGKCVGKTLLHLSVTCNNDNCNILAGVHSLSDFASLEECRLSLNILCAPPFDGTYKAVPDGDSGLQRWTISSMCKVMPSIEDIMPASIKTFTLEVHDSGRISAEHFAALQTLFRARQKITTLGAFSNLKNLVVEMYGGSQGLESIEQLLRACGAEIQTMGW